MSNSIYNYTRSDLEKYFIEKNLAKFRATQVIEGVYREKVKDFSEISNLSKDVKGLLKEDFAIFLTEARKSSTDISVFISLLFKSVF
jgi:adenine C2-methylase RlmN of 23S rRNA A2503 and tRNA A37